MGIVKSLFIPTTSVILVIAVVTVMFTKKARRKATPATTAMIIPLVGALCAVMTGVTCLGLLIVRLQQHNECISRAGRSEAAYIQYINTYNVFDHYFGPQYTHDMVLPGQPPLRQTLEDLKPLNPDNCPGI